MDHTNINLMSLIRQLDVSWIEIFDKYEEVLKLIETKLNTDKLTNSTLRHFPPRENIFLTFTYLKVSEIKVIILGQDCYHKENQAIGVSFGITDGIKIPPSLRNIKKELNNDLGISLESNDLLHWNRDGVLLLNCALTVRESCAGSHLSIWKPLVIQLLNDICEQNTNIVFILWGNFAKDIYKKLSHNSELSIRGTHPSPLSANKGGFFGNKYFSKTNDILEKLNKEPIKW